MDDFIRIAPHRLHDHAPLLHAGHVQNLAHHQGKPLRLGGNKGHPAGYFAGLQRIRFFGKLLRGLRIAGNNRQRGFQLVGDIPQKLGFQLIQAFQHRFFCVQLLLRFLRFREYPVVHQEKGHRLRQHEHQHSGFGYGRVGPIAQNIAVHDDVGYCGKEKHRNAEQGGALFLRGAAHTPKHTGDAGHNAQNQQYLIIAQYRRIENGITKQHEYPVNAGADDGRILNAA